MTDPLLDLDVFYGDLTGNRAYVYARLPRPAEASGLTLAGQVRGPRCLHAQTLPLAAPLVDSGPGPTLLARALIPDPVFWSPDLPAIYDVTVRLQRGSQTVGTAHREIGLRGLGVRGRSLYLAGERYVVRGVSRRATTATLARHWHDARAAFVHDDSESDALAEASQWGALAVIHLPEGPLPIADRLRRLAQFPAAAVAVISGEMPPGFKKSLVCPNLLLAQLRPAMPAAPCPPWADLVLADAMDTGGLRAESERHNLPIIAWRSADIPQDIVAARAACDQLQRDLAAVGQFAGYII